jgi:HAD superfamily hydrolase (TIGR01549 family)
MVDQYAPYSTILFDFDGTLTPSLDLWIAGLRYAFQKFGLDPDDEAIIRDCFYRPFEEIVLRYKISSSDDFTKYVYAGISRSFEQARLFAGVVEVLEICRELGIKLGVVTSSPRSVVAKTLQNLGIASFFETIVTADDVSYRKPHPEPVLSALRNLGESADHCLLIGDSSADILAGQAARLKTALFFPPDHSRFYKYDELESLAPDFIFRHYDDILAHLSEPLFQTT